MLKITFFYTKKHSTLFGVLLSVIKKGSKYSLSSYFFLQWKFEVSKEFFIFGNIGAVISLKLSQETP